MVQQLTIHKLKSCIFTYTCAYFQAVQWIKAFVMVRHIRFEKIRFLRTFRNTDFNYLKHCIYGVIDRKQMIACNMPEFCCLSKYQLPYG